MASLTNITSILDNVFDRNSRRSTVHGTPVELPLNKLNDLLQKILSSSSTQTWHEQSREQDLGANENLRQLCQDIAAQNTKAIERSNQVHVRTTEIASSPRIESLWTHEEAVKCRRDMLSCLAEIRKAFDFFSIVGDDHSLRRPQTRDVVVAYLRSTYMLMINIGRIVEPREDFDWLNAMEEYFHSSELHDFKFDGPDDYNRIGKSLSKVLIFPQSTPSNCDSAFPQRPVFVLNINP